MHQPSPKKTRSERIPGEPVAARLVRRTAVVSQFIYRFRLELQIRRDLAILSAVDDRLLADMGLTRRQLGCAVRQGCPIDRGSITTDPARKSSMAPMPFLSGSIQLAWR